MRWYGEDGRGRPQRPDPEPAQLREVASVTARAGTSPGRSRRSARSDCGQTMLEITANGYSVPDGDEHAEARHRTERAGAAHQFRYLPSGETPNVLAPDDRDHLEELVLCGVDEPLVALEECVEVVLDLGRQRSYRGRRQREVGGQLPW